MRLIDLDAITEAFSIPYPDDIKSISIEYKNIPELLKNFDIAKVYYICDGKACEHCHPEDCHLTSKIEHAVNFRKGDVDEYVEKYKPVSIPVQWLNHYDRALANKLIKEYNASLGLISPFNDD